MQTGGFATRGGHEKINASPDTELSTTGLGLYYTGAGAKTVIRSAGTKLQSFSLDSGVFTNLTEDTASSNSSFLSATSTNPTVFSEFNTASSDVLWCAGGGMSLPYGIYSSTKVTKNGASNPTGSISLSIVSSGGTLGPGTYFYSVALRKAGTQVTSNADLDKSIEITTGDSALINLSSVVSGDTTKYDQIWIYRSAAGGATGFTTGDLIAKVSISTTSYTDTGTYITTAVNVPRAGSALADNSTLGAGTYNTLTTWKRRLVVASGSTLYFSDLNKPESWPTLNTITIPSGGPITGLAIIGFSTDFSNDELLAVFKEREVWIVTGNTLADWSLKFVDNTGCANQPLIVQANGWLTWVDYRGIYLWDGSGKPIYCSRPIESLFDKSGDLDKSNLALGHGRFYKKKNQVIWYLSSKTYGVNKYSLKLDTRLTLPRVSTDLSGRVLDGVFIQDTFNTSYNASLYFLPSTNEDEVMLLGDDSGYIYKGYNAYSDGGAAYSMTYETKFLDMGDPETDKRFTKVIAWVPEVGTTRLYLDYWTSYAFALSEVTTESDLIANSTQTGEALWDVGYWDVAYWDVSTAGYRPIVFNLKPGLRNANEGKCLKLRFRVDTADSPITIGKFSVVYSEKGSTN